MMCWWRALTPSNGEDYTRQCANWQGTLWSVDNWACSMSAVRDGGIDPTTCNMYNHTPSLTLEAVRWASNKAIDSNVGRPHRQRCRTSDDPRLQNRDDKRRRRKRKTQARKARRKRRGEARDTKNSTYHGNNNDGNGSSTDSGSGGGAWSSDSDGDGANEGRDARKDDGNDDESDDDDDDDDGGREEDYTDGSDDDDTDTESQDDDEGDGEDDEGTSDDDTKPLLGGAAKPSSEAAQVGLP